MTYVWPLSVMAELGFPDFDLWCPKDFGCNLLSGSWLQVVLLSCMVFPNLGPGILT